MLPVGRWDLDSPEHGGNLTALEVLCLAGAVFLPLLLVPAGAQPSSPDDGVICGQVDTGYVAILACTREIASDKYEGRNLAILHNMRGLAYRASGDLNGAIADYGRAIEIDPKF